jgi:predicted Rossmann-fold nucleotide-binding protein
VVFPGGFEALDELLEMLTLAQHGKGERRIPILLYGSVFWKEILNFDALVRYGVIVPDDLRLFAYVDDPESALRIVQQAAAAESGRAAARSSS